MISATASKSQMFGISWSPSPCWSPCGLNSCSSTKPEPNGPTPSRRNDRVRALKLQGDHGGPDEAAALPPLLAMNVPLEAGLLGTVTLFRASSGPLYSSTNLENISFTSSVLSTQLTKWAASDVARTPRVGCALKSALCLLPPPAGAFLLLSWGDGTQQQLLLREEALAAGRLRSRRSEFRRLHSARHRKWAGEGQKIQSGTRSRSGFSELLLPSSGS
mmetsp:Transcript_18734/g.52931  ORF Transcript_18734/g.52931 Transcript_18734/m.52931 type:complete len:218 (-) Transcript_18734:181-834(-)